MTKHAPCLTRFLGRLRGASQPILAETSDGQVVVVKFRSNPEDANLLFNEAMGSELYAAAGLAVPGWMSVTVSEAFLEKNPGSWPLDAGLALPPRPGTVFASRYIHANGGRVTQILPGSSLSRVEQREDFWLAWLLDVCAQHTDHRQALFIESASRRLRAVFIDHGQMFGGPAGAHQPRFRASRFLDQRLYPQPSDELKKQLLDRAERIDSELLCQSAEQLPEEWQSPLAAGRLAACLERLTKPSLLGHMLDTLFEDCESGAERGGRLPVESEDWLPGTGQSALRQRRVRLQAARGA